MSCVGGSFYAQFTGTRLQLEGLPWPVVSIVQQLPPKTTQGMNNGHWHTGTPNPYITWHNSLLEKNSSGNQTMSLLFSRQRYYHCAKSTVTNYLLCLNHSLFQILNFYVGNESILWTKNSRYTISSVLTKSAISSNFLNQRNSCYANWKTSFNRPRDNSEKMKPRFDE